MTEQEYIDVTDLRSYRCALSALNWAQPSIELDVIRGLVYKEINRLEPITDKLVTTEGLVR